MQYAVEFNSKQSLRFAKNYVYYVDDMFDFILEIMMILIDL